MAARVAQTHSKKSDKPDKSDMLAARPVRADGAVEKLNANGTWQVTVSLKPTRWARLLFRAPGGGGAGAGGGGMKKTFELDELGKFVWDACDGKTAVRRIIRKLADRYNLNQREAEVATVAFLQMLTRKGLVGISIQK